jgi:hypothetical protein
MHRAPEYGGALFQVASQFDALEMTGANVTPEDGVTRYQHDHTQGPACAIAAGAARSFGTISWLSQAALARPRNVSSMD